MSGNTKNLGPLWDADLLDLLRDKLENPSGLDEFERHWLGVLADRFEELTGDN